MDAIVIFTRQVHVQVFLFEIQRPNSTKTKQNDLKIRRNSFKE